jgi:hypothetical protein
MTRGLLIALGTLIGALALAAPASALEYVSVLEVGGQNAQTETDAMCPEGKHVTGGGGFSNQPYDTTTINDSYPIDGPDANTEPDDGWRGTFDNPTSAFPNFTTMAICGKGLPKYRSKAFATHQVVTTRSCPKGSKPSGGGVSIDGTLAQESRITRSIPGDGLDENLKPDSWVGYGEAAGLAQIPARVYAICVPKRKALRYRMADIAVPPELAGPGRGRVP